ncbi:MAG TPA: conjugal transfer mating pair stabilization protein TraN, partial [Aggregatilineaceae bacterium]|nr:conjugal transfer mating pair stabilization protein TraN [Aggregatilineaceae bacterium]
CTRLTRAIALFLAWLIIWTPLQRAVADAMQDSARLGQAAAKQSVQSFPLPSVSPDGSTLTLFPGTGKELSIDTQQLFPDSGNGQASTFTQLYGDNAASVAAGLSAQTTLETESSHTGEAYRTLIHAANRSHPDLSNDPVWGSTDYVMANHDLFAKTFADCTSNTVFSEAHFSARSPDYRTCVRGPNVPSQCTATHDLVVEPVIVPDAGETKISSCGEGCADIWVGKVGDNYWCSGCGVFTSTSRYLVKHPEAILSAQILDTYWDDYIRIHLNGQQIWQGSDGWNPGQCEMSTSWHAAPGTDVTAYFLQPGALVFDVKVLVSGCGEGYAKIRIRYDPKKVIVKDDWVLQNQGCQNLLNAAADGLCSNVNTSCAIDPGVVVNGKSCIKIATTAGQLQVCEPNFVAPPIPGVAPTCSQATMIASCDLSGRNAPCWTDIDGVQHCPNQVVGQTETCKTLENQGCAFIRSQCVDGAQGAATGTCWLYKDVYDCGASVTIPTLQGSSTQQCSGPVRCMGEECVDITRNQSQDFVRATAALNAAQQAAMDQNCADPNDLTTCTVFKGEGGTCKTVGALVTSVDCCNAPQSIGLGQYLDLLTHIGQMNNAVMRLDSGNAFRGAWQVLRDPVANVYQETLQSFDTLYDSITGNCTATVSNFFEHSLIQQFSDLAMEQVATWVGETFGAAAGNLIFSSGGAAAFSESGSLNSGVTGSTLEVGGGGAMIGSMLNVIMIAYAVYQILVMIVQLIWQCEQKEYELAAKKSLKACTYLGSYCATQVLGLCVEERESYCCFSSPLARILQEQIRPQLGMSFGDMKNPSCGGIPIDQLARVDWNQVNLDEWIAILQSTGHLPTAANAGQKLNLDQLTGQGSRFNVNGIRLNTLDRNVQRLSPLDVPAIRTQSEAQAWGLGPKN